MWGERYGIDHEMKMVMLAPSSAKDWKGFVNVNQIVLQHVPLTNYYFNLLSNYIW